MEAKKYTLDKKDTLRVNGRKLSRIVALRDIPAAGVNKGDKGGYVASQDNLAHQGDCWVPQTSIVHGAARIEGDVKIGFHAQIWSYAAHTICVGVVADCAKLAFYVN